MIAGMTTGRKVPKNRSPSHASSTPLQMRPNRHSLVIQCSLLAGLMLPRLILPLRPEPMDRQDLLIEDAYISLNISRNLAEGRGLTQGGKPTNGIQPLWVFLCAPFYWISHGDMTLRLAALMGGALGVAAAWAAYQISRQVLGEAPAFWVLLLWTVSPGLLFLSLNGLETSLAHALALLVILLHLHPPNTRWGRLGQGLLDGLMVLARLDLLMLWGLLILDEGFTFHFRRREQKSEGIDANAVKSLRGAAPLTPASPPVRAGPALRMVAAILAVSPWFLWSRLECGRWTPTSGEATRLISQLYGNPLGPVPDPNYFSIGRIPAHFYQGETLAGLRTVLLSSPFALPCDWTTPRPTGVTLLSAVDRKARTAALLLLTLFLAAWLLHRRRRVPANDKGRLTRLIRSLWFFWLFLPMLFLAYTGYVFGQWHFARYLSPLIIGLIFPTALWLETVTHPLTRPAAGRLALGAIVAVGFALPAFRQMQTRFQLNPLSPEYRMAEDAQRLEQWLPPGSRVGTFESGILDYFLTDDVINMDGKTNAVAFSALREGAMERFVIEARLDYIASSPPLLRDLLYQRGHWPPGMLEPVLALKHNQVLRVNRDKILSH